MTRLKTIHLESCSSTSDLAWEYKPGPTLVIADHQTRGRGRSGREWNSEQTGNLYCSLLTNGPTDSSLLTWISLIAGVAAAEELAETLPVDLRDFGFHLKWPNDLILTLANGDDTKLGGILCESRTQAFSKDAALVVIGFGLNILSAPTLSDRKTIAVVDIAPAFDKTVFAQKWASRVIKLVDILNSGDKGLDLVKSAWKRWAQLERYSEIETHDADGKTVTAHAIDIDNIGRLICKYQGSDKIFSIS